MKICVTNKGIKYTLMKHDNMLKDNSNNEPKKETITAHDSEKAYLEHYAKELLESLFPTLYAGIQHSECPDLLMGVDYGIEVTWAMYENQGRARGLLKDSGGKTINELNKGVRRNIEGTNIKMITDEDGTICGYTDSIPRNRITDYELFHAYEKKKKKVRNYSTKITDLFIYPALAKLDGWLGADIIGNFMKIIDEPYECPFSNIIVFEEPTLYLYDYSEHRMHIVRAQPETITKCQLAANEYSGYSIRNQR